MNEETWHEARLIPTSGISGADEQERRATSAFLAVLSSVKEYGRTLLGPVGAPAAAVQTYVEVPFELDEQRLYPDGLIRVTRGSKTWTALVEVKTGTNDLDADQLSKYLAIAKREGFDALVTISNEIPGSNNEHPTLTAKQIPGGVAVHHWSWAYLLSQAVLQKEHRGVHDPDQAWILGELIRYLEHPRSGALEFDSMGSNWVPVREAAQNGTLRAGDKPVDDVVARFEGLIQYAALRLGRQLGADVSVGRSRKEATDVDARRIEAARVLASTGELTASLRVPNLAGPLHVSANLINGRVTCFIDVDAPKEGRPLTRVNWLLRQLATAPETTRVEATVAYSRGDGAAELLSTLRERPETLILDPNKDFKSFRIAMSSPMGSKSSRGRNSFIDSVIESIDEFYGSVAQNIKVWAPSPPRQRDEPAEAQDELSSTGLSSQDLDVDSTSAHMERPFEAEALRLFGPDHGLVLDEQTEAAVAWLTARQETFGERWFYMAHIASFASQDLGFPVDERWLVIAEFIQGRLSSRDAEGRFLVRFTDPRITQ